MKKLIIAGIAVGVAVLIALVLVLMRPGQDTPSVDPTATATATATDEPSVSPSAEEDAGWTRAEIAEALFTGEVGTTESLGSVTGAIPDRITPIPATVEVTEVTAGEASTVVRFTLRNVDDSDPLLSLGAFNSRSPLTKDIRDVALVVPAENVRFQPFLGVPLDPEKDGSFCTCSKHPTKMSQVGQLLSATFPPLAAGTTTVSLEVPGFPLIENLPVSRD